MKEVTDKLGFIEIKIYSVKYNNKRIGRQATDWETILAKDTFAKGLLSIIYKELKIQQ